MDYIVWLPEYSVGVAEIDYQHKELLNFMNYAINHCTGNKREEMKFFNKTVDSAIENLTNHFSTEEKIMEKTNYPKYNEHKKEHDKITEELIVMIEGIKNGTVELELAEVISFLKNWILNHIPQYDKEAKEYFLKGYEK
ncbi:MAG: bacteriohemerythrin [Treponema sp.]|jgi:hemerythrin|nr:bacteriohemerythrin [Treponema sp.]